MAWKATCRSEHRSPAIARLRGAFDKARTARTSVTTPVTFIGARDFTGGTLPAADLSGVIDIARFTSTIRPVEVLAALPATGNLAGRKVFRTTDNKLYRRTGSPSGTTG